jgi:hypothetical protein
MAESGNHNLYSKRTRWALGESLVVTPPTDFPTFFFFFFLDLLIAYPGQQKSCRGQQEKIGYYGKIDIRRLSAYKFSYYYFISLYIPVKGKTSLFATKGGKKFAQSLINDNISNNTP